jgi:cobalt-zinc-cadmium efflux system outer membrane protein
MGGRYANGPVVSLSVDLPLFNKGQAEKTVAAAEAARTRARRQALESQILADVRGAHESLLLRRRIAEQYEDDSGRRAEELREIAEVAYAEGELGILELLDAFRVSQQSKLRLLELRAAAKLAEIDLDRAMGAEALP